MNTTGNFIYPYFLPVSFSIEGKFLSISTFFLEGLIIPFEIFCVSDILCEQRLCQNRNLSNLLYYIISAYWRLCHALCRWLVDTIFPTSVDFQKELLGPQGTASIDYFIFHSVFYIKHSIKQRKT